MTARIIAVSHGGVESPLNAGVLTPEQQNAWAALRALCREVQEFSESPLGGTMGCGGRCLGCDHSSTCAAGRMYLQRVAAGLRQHVCTFGSSEDDAG